MTTQTSQETSRKRTAINASRGTTFLLNPREVKIIGFDTPHKKGEHVLWQRRALDEVDTDLVNYMVENGFAGVIDVRKNGPDIEVVAGRRRTKAARRANEIRVERGLPEINAECKLVRGTDSELFGRVISENMLRKDVESMDLAEDIHSYMSLGRSFKDASLVCGKTVPQVKLLLKLLDLAPEVQDAVRTHAISWTAGAELSDLRREDQVGKLGELIAAGNTTVARVKATVTAAKTGEEVTEVPGKRLVTKLLGLEEEVVEVFGPDGIRAMRFMLGQLPPHRIKGLTALIAKVTTTKK